MKYEWRLAINLKHFYDMHIVDPQINLITSVGFLSNASKLQQMKIRVLFIVSCFPFGCLPFYPPQKCFSLRILPFLRYAKNLGWSK